MREWDPIGVNGIPEAQDEYDTYVAKAYVMLMDDGAPANEIAAYLIWVESEHMGLGLREGARARALAVAQALVDMRPRLEEEIKN